MTEKKETEIPPISLAPNKIDKHHKMWLDKKLAESTSRRSVLKWLTLASVASVLPSPEAEASTFDSFFQKHYKEMTPEDKTKVFKRLEQKTKQDYGADVKIRDPQAIPGVHFAFCLSLSKCNGSRRCVTACMEENNISDPANAYIKVIEMNQGSMNMEKGDLYYEGKEVPKENKFYLPVQCNQCDNPPCTKVCPVEATWKENDGIVAIDYDWCIGCRYCMAACPYEARRFNFKVPDIAAESINPNQGYLSNRIKPKGVVEKCHFCMHRTREGNYPACLEACPTGARKFGNLNDPQSEVALILKEKQVFVLKEELNTVPQFFYYFD